MTFPFDLTEDATADLEDVVADVAEESQSAALKLADHLERAFRFLADWPSAGHQRQDLTDCDSIRFWPVGKYLIVYLPASKPILVIAVFHGARDVESLLLRRVSDL